MSLEAVVVERVRAVVVACREAAAQIAHDPSLAESKRVEELQRLIVEMGKAIHVRLTENTQPQ